MPRDIPIIFSSPMVRAMLDGRKTMTRRLAWTMSTRQAGILTDLEGREPKPSPWQKVVAGDRLYVRENISRFDKGSCDEHVWFWAGGNRPSYVADAGTSEGRWPADVEGPGTGKSYSVPCIHMPRWASRLTLIVSAVKVERLQSISPQDAWDEGVERRSSKVRQMSLFGADAVQREEIYKRACVWEFEDLWTRLHGTESWASNPEVVALSFSVICANIDSRESRTA
jgi:hypothetical protein